MSKLKLTIVMPTEMIYEGEADRIMVRAAMGDMMVLPGHIDYTAALGNGEARITVNGSTRKAKIEGGMIHISKDVVRILTNCFAWQDSTK